MSQDKGTDLPTERPNDDTQATSEAQQRPEQYIDSLMAHLVMPVTKREHERIKEAKQNLLTWLSENYEPKQPRFHTTDIGWKRICDYCSAPNPEHTKMLSRTPNGETTYAEICNQCFSEIISVELDQLVAAGQHIHRYDANMDTCQICKLTPEQLIKNTEDHIATLRGKGEIEIMSIRTKDRIAHYIARHLPKRLVMWSFIVVTSHSTTGEYGHTVVPDLSAMDALDRYARDFNLHENEQPTTVPKKDEG